ncbi:MAG: outer membrane lipoprotein carrier protein LolA [Deltaproteobacteria bacterium GWA2_54_12]|nr:MAG: outer membrane lipoprotein carrier protein LolA [Deltaproteobacteria bacterium GWA2_54_12]
MKNHFHNKLITLLALAALFILPALSFAGDAAAVVSKLQSKYESITSLKADFTQEVTSRGMPALKSEGKVWLKKPGRMRWEYKKPAKDLIVSDGRTIWLFQPDLNQVIERPALSSASSMATDFLSGIGSVEKEFDVKLAALETVNHVLILTPKQEQAGLKKLILEVGKETSIVEKTVITDHFGNQTAVTFSNIRLNASMKDSLFKYTPPRGASIVRP